MTRSTETVVCDLEAQLVVQRTATAYYQRALNVAFTNLRMMGREDVVKSIQKESLADTRTALVTLAVVIAPQPVSVTEDDDCLY